MSGVNTGVPQEPPKDFLLFVAELHIREAVVGMLKYKTRGAAGGGVFSGVQHFRSELDLSISGRPRRERTLFITKFPTSNGLDHA